MPRRFHLERPNGNRWRKRVFLSRGCGTPPNTSGQGRQHPNFGTSYMTPIRYYTQQTNSAPWSNYMRVKFYQVDYAFGRDQMFLMCACISRPTGWRVIIICTCFYCSRSSREALDVIRSSIMHENNALSHWPTRRKKSDRQIGSLTKSFVGDISGRQFGVTCCGFFQWACSQL